MQSAKPLVSKLCKETEPNSQIAEDDSLSLDTLKKRVSDIELMMLEREHRWFYVYYNTIRHIWSERTRWPVIKSLIAHTLSPTTICATTGGICAITMAFLAYNANDLLKEQNIAVVKQTALIEQQTTLIEKQNVLQEAARRAAVLQEMTEIFDGTTASILQKQIANPQTVPPDADAAFSKKFIPNTSPAEEITQAAPFILPEVTQGRIIAVSSSCRPYRYQKDDGQLTAC